MDQKPEKETRPICMGIAQRIERPSPEQIRAARKAANMSQEQAARLISTATASVYRTWQSYEAPLGSQAHREIPLASWELFLLQTGQHPTLTLTQRQEVVEAS